MATKSPPFSTLYKILESGCWEWQGNIQPNGYGRYRGVSAHRMSYELWVAEIPKGLVIDHLCRNRKCINPNHLEPVTSKENLLRGVGACAVNAKKQTCKNGHVFDEVNTYLVPGGRSCKACHREIERKRRELKRSLSNV